jgi:demethylmenaquinone methyltransferase/2-methoxy-6-polyprenyl-1,4-benzoquinol methylase
VNHLPKSLEEQFRVLKSRGMLVALDTTPPPRNLLTPLIRFHLHRIIPTLGKVLSGHTEAYHYLPETTENFLDAEKLADRLRTAGFEEVGFRRLMFSTIAIHWGRKPE